MNKLLINLIKPYKIPGKIIRKIKFLINKRRYNQNEYEKKQNNIFESIGLNRNLGIEKLNLIKCIKNDKIPLSGGREGYNALELITACMISAKQNKKKSIPLNKYDYIVYSK